MIGAWVLIDVVLVSKFAFQATGPVFYSSLVAVQLWSIAEVIGYVFSRLRRRRPSVQARRAEDYRRGLLAYLKDDLRPAEAAFDGIVRRDPWDLTVVIALATVLARSGEPKQLRRSRTLLRIARDLDVSSAFTDVIESESERLGRI